MEKCRAIQLLKSIIDFRIEEVLACLESPGGEEEAVSHLKGLKAARVQLVHFQWGVEEDKHPPKDWYAISSIQESAKGAIRYYLHEAISEPYDFESLRRALELEVALTTLDIPVIARESLECWLRNRNGIITYEYPTWRKDMKDSDYRRDVSGENEDR